MDVLSLAWGSRHSPGILTPENCYTASFSAAKVDMVTCPLHSHRQPLHQIVLCLCSHIYGEKNWADCTGLYLRACQNDEISPSPCPAHARLDTRVYWHQLEGQMASLVSIVHSHISVSDKNVKKRLPSWRGQGARHTLAEADLQWHRISDPQASRHSAAGAPAKKI